MRQVELADVLVDDAEVRVVEVGVLVDVAEVVAAGTDDETEAVGHSELV